MSLKHKLIIASLACLAVANGRASAAPDITELLRRVDEYRSPKLATYLSKITMRPRHGEKQEEPSQYTVLNSAGRGAIITANTGDQVGQKFLGTDAGFWFFAPRTHRAIRLTPIQVIRGQASVGDISRLKFERDYKAISASKRTDANDSELDLILQANSQAATYSKVELQVRSDGKPISGKFYSQSGRILKTIVFGRVVEVDGYRIIAETTYVDGIDPSASTSVNITGIKGASAQSGMFTPEALSTQ